MRIDQPFEQEMATVVKHGFALSAEKKTPYVWLEFEFDNLKADDDSAITVTAQLYLSDAALDYSLEKLGNLGWDGKSVVELDPNEPSAHSFIGKKALITGTMEDYKGKMYPKVNFINDPDKPRDRTIDKKELSALGSRLSGKIAAYRKKNGGGATTKPVTPTTSSTATDNDIPF